MDLLTFVLAAAGGGSSGFGGGGGGGGGSSFGGGGSSFGGGGGGTGTQLSGAGLVVFLLLFLGFALLVCWAVVAAYLASRRKRRLRAARVQRVAAASAEAAEDDPAFAADVVREGAERLFVAIQEAWDARDLELLGSLAEPELLVEWRRRLEDFAAKGWHNRVRVTGRPEVEYVGLVNRTGSDDDRVTVRVHATLEDYVEDRHGNVIRKNDAASTSTQLTEYWTLRRRDARWVLASIESDGEGDHHLRADIIAMPEADPTLADAALTELAVADAPTLTEPVAALADVHLDDRPREQALDLMLVDARFDPQVLTAGARTVLAGWLEAVDGEDDALLAVADEAAATALLHGGDTARRTRVVVRGAAVDRADITALDGHATPATMTLDLTLRGRMYVEDRDTAAVLRGSKEAERTWTERWTLALSEGAEHPWRLVGTAAGG